MRRCLVTGAAGFLGSHLVDHLLRKGWTVVGLDNLYTGRLENLAHLEGEPRFKLLQRNVWELTSSAVGYVDAVFNLACPASPPHYQRDPVFTLRTCFEGTLACLELAACYGAPLLQASTSEVYGDPEIHPQPEEYRGAVSVTGPRACYDEGKRVAETLCAEYRRRNGVDARIARIFNTYGPRMDPEDGRVVSNFITQALRGEPLTVYGDGSQTRSLCYVDDLVRGLYLLAEHPEEVGPINLGRDRESTVLELAEHVLRLTGSSSRIVFRDLPADDPVRRRPDLRRAARVLGYEPEVPLEAGLSWTVDYFRARLARG